MHLTHFIKGDTVESLNEVHSQIGTIPFILRLEGVLSGRSKIYENHLKNIILLLGLQPVSFAEWFIVLCPYFKESTIRSEVPLCSCL